MNTENAISLLRNTAWLGTNHHVDEIQKAVTIVEKLYKDYKDCRNELCLNCGKYKADECKDCRWKNGM